MKNDKTKTEYANEKINEYFNKDNEKDAFDIDPLFNNNNISLVVKNIDKNNNS